MFWQSDIASPIIQKNTIKGLAIAIALSFCSLLLSNRTSSWLQSGSLKILPESGQTVRLRILPYEETDAGGGQGGGEGGGSLSAPLPKQIPARPVPVPDALAPADTFAVTPPVSPAIDSSNAGGTGLPGSSWGSGGTGWGTGKGEGVGLGRIIVAQPRPVLEAIPEYPQAARKAKIQGLIELSVKVDETGKVEKVIVLRNTTQNDACAQAAIEAAYRTRYRPAQTAAGPDTAWVVRQYSFALDK